MKLQMSFTVLLCACGSSLSSEHDAGLDDTIDGRASERDSGDRDATRDAGACGELLSELNGMDAPGSCESDEDCNLVGAYSVGPKCTAENACIPDPEVSGVRGVFVTSGDEGRALSLLTEAHKLGCVEPECALDGVTYEPRCSLGTCVAEARCCNCAP